jgi:hypothetical protein
MPQGLSYVQEGHDLVLYIRNIIPDDVGILLEPLAYRGGAMLNFPFTEFSEVRLIGILRTSPFGHSRKFAKKVVINTAIE